MKNIESLEEARNLIESGSITLLYLSRPDCGVCTALKPKVEQMLEEYPGIRAGYIDLDALPEAAGEFSIFTIPGILVYVHGKESVREARYVSMDDLESKIARPYQFLFPSSR